MEELGFLGGSMVKQETQVQFLFGEDALEKDTATHSSILARRTPQTEEHGGLYSPWRHKESDITWWLNNNGRITDWKDFSVHDGEDPMSPLDSEHNEMTQTPGNLSLLQILNYM